MQQDQWWARDPVVQQPQAPAQRPAQPQTEWWAQDPVVGQQPAAPPARQQAPARQQQPPARQTPQPQPDPLMYGNPSFTNGAAITGDDTPEQIQAKLIASGIPESEVADILAQYQAEASGAPYAVVSSQDLAPTDTPESLRAQGYEIDPIRNVWARVVGQQPLPAPLRNEQQPASPGYQLAVQQELAKAEAMPGYADVGFTDQATAPLNDELAFAIGYAQQGLANFGRGLFGGQNDVSAMDRARAMYDIQRANQAEYERERPVSSFLGQTLGGFALAPSRVAGAGMAFARPTMAQGYRQAAGAGGAYGAAEGNSVQERLGMGALGAGAGVATAGLLDAGLGAVANRLARQQQGLPAPERRAANALGNLMRRDQMTTPEEVLAAIPEGGLPMDIDTPFFQAGVESLANTPGPGRQRIIETTQRRRGEAANTFRQGIEESLGGRGDYFATLDASMQARRQAADQGIRAIEGQRFRLNEDAVTSLRSDLAQQEIRRIAQLSLGSPDPALRDNGAALNRLADTLLDNPAAADLDLRSAQELSRRLLNASDDAWRGGDGFRGQVLGDIGRAVRNNASESIPAYRQWLRQYGEDSDNIQAMELGRRALQNLNDPRADGMSAENLRRQFGELSDIGKDMFRKGVGEALVAQARATGDLNAMRRILRSEEMADRIRVAFPDEQAYTRFLNGIENQIAMTNRDARIIGGSPTDFRQEARRMMGGTGVEDAASRGLANTSLSGLAMEGIRQTARPITRAIDRNRSVLQNPQSNEALGRAMDDADYLRQLLMASMQQRQGLFGGRAPAGVAGAIGTTLQNRLIPAQ